MMKKFTALLLTVMMACGLAACGGAGAESGGTTPAPETSAPPAGESPQPEETTSPSQPAEPSEPPAQVPDSSAPTASDPPAADGSKTLIAYFSWSGNTEELAGMIQEATGGDLFAIETETPYTDDYNAVVDQAQQEQADNARPALAAQVENMDDYDTVFIGYPNWWSDVPMAVLTFLESYDWTGKTVIPFCTSGGGGFGNGINSIEAATEGAVVLEGFHVGGSSVSGAKEDVAAWLSANGITTN